MRMISRDETLGIISSSKYGGISPEESEDSRKIFEHYKKKAQLVTHIIEIAKECADYGWDGDRAEPVSGEVVDAAKRLVRLLPISQPLPEPCPDADGEMGMEWHVSASKWGLVTVGPTKLHFAICLDDTYRNTGSLPFGEKSLGLVLEAISFLYRA